MENRRPRHGSKSPHPLTRTRRGSRVVILSAARDPRICRQTTAGIVLVSNPKLLVFSMREHCLARARAAGRSLSEE